MTPLVKYEAAKAALAEARRVDDVKDIRDKAEALQAYARQRNDVEMERWVAEIKLRASVRIGELSLELEKVVTKGGGKVGIPSGGKPKAEVLAAAGISTSAAHRFETLAAHQQEVEQYIAEKAGAGEIVTITKALAKVKTVTQRGRAALSAGGPIETGALASALESDAGALGIWQGLENGGLLFLTPSAEHPGYAFVDELNTVEGYCDVATRPIRFDALSLFYKEARWLRESDATLIRDLVPERIPDVDALRLGGAETARESRAPS